MHETWNAALQIIQAGSTIEQICVECEFGHLIKFFTG